MSYDSEFVRYVSGVDELELVSWTVGAADKTVTVMVPKSFVKELEEVAERYGFERVRKNNRSHEYPASITFKKTSE